jgi:hypothetical protein
MGGWIGQGRALTYRNEAIGEQQRCRLLFSTMGRQKAVHRRQEKRRRRENDGWTGNETRKHKHPTAEIKLLICDPSDLQIKNVNIKTDVF